MSARQGTYASMLLHPSTTTSADLSRHFARIDAPRRDEGTGLELEVLGDDYDITPTLLEHARLRVGIALDRVAHHVRKVRLRLSDANGHRGGSDQCCRVECRLTSGEPLFVEATDADAYVAIDLATTRLKSAVVKEVGRRTERRRN